MSPVTSKTVVGVFSNADQARGVVEDLRQAGFPQDSISMVFRPDRSAEGTEPSEVIKDASVGAVAGAIGGVLLAAVAAPGIGPVLVMGPILAALGGASLGAVTGGLIGAFTKIGVPRSKAAAYAESVKRGDAIVTVRTDHVGAERALRIMNEHGALDMDAKAESWSQTGWVGHAPGVEPRSEDELRREHEFYAAGGQRVAEWEPETVKEQTHAGDEPGTLWPHHEAHDIGEDLVEAATPPEPLPRK